MTRTWIVTGLLALTALAGCRRDFEDDFMSAPPPPPAALIAPVRDSMTLDGKLERLEAELAAAIEGGLEDEAVYRMFRAEAITDRLLESALPFNWLGEGYYVDARLRQLQALADRIVAQSRRGEPRQQILADAIELHRRVVELRTALAEPGGEPPPTLDSLLAAVAAEESLAPVSEGETGE